MLRQVAALSLAFAFCSCTTTPTPASALRAFNSNDTMLANAGYMELYYYNVLAIPLLLDNAARTDPFAGNAYQDASQSIIAPQPTQAIISLYLIEAIRVGHQNPHVTPLLIDKDNKTPPTAYNTALNAYKTWWAPLANSTLDQVRRAPDPLGGTGLTWR